MAAIGGPQERIFIQDDGWKIHFNALWISLAAQAGNGFEFMHAIVGPREASPKFHY